jgi:ketosteroid isomerase-like protein
VATAQVATAIDRAGVERLSERFAKVFETQEAGQDLFSPDVFFDLNMPVWRFQLESPEAFAAQLKKIVEGDVRIEVLRTVQTLSGFVTEHQEHQAVDGQDLTARRLWLCEVRDGRIAEAVGYCTGEWDEELRTRHAVEAPMIRP